MSLKKIAKVRTWRDYVKLRQLLKRYCKTHLDIRSVFFTFKVRNMSSVKGSVSQSVCLRFFMNSYVLAVMLATLVRPLATFVHACPRALCVGQGFACLRALAVIRELS